MQHKLIIMTEINPNVDVNPNADEIKNLEAQIAQIDVTKLDPSDNGKTKQPVVEQTTQTTSDIKVENVTETTINTNAEDPIKTELERVKGQTQGKTPKEKFEYKLQRELAQAKEMGIDVTKLAGIPNETQVEDDEKPLTRKDLESILSSVNPSKKAIDMAMEIGNEAERELHLHYLENKVNPNLSEEEKFQTAKDMVNAIKLKNQMILNNIKPTTNSHSSASSFIPAKNETFDNQKLTKEEEMFFRDAEIRGVPLTKEEILKMR